MTPAERAVIDAAIAWATGNDSSDSERLLAAVDALTEPPPVRVTDRDGDVWERRENGLYSVAESGHTGWATLGRIRETWGVHS